MNQSINQLFYLFVCLLLLLLLLNIIIKLAILLFIYEVTKVASYQAQKIG